MSAKNKVIAAISAVFSLFISGSGHILSGHLKSGFIFFIIDVIASFLLMLLAAHVEYGIWLYFLLFFSYKIFIIIDIFRKMSLANISYGIRKVLIILLVIASFYSARHFMQYWINENMLTIFRIPTGGMSPTIEAGDTIIARKELYIDPQKIKRGDLVIIKAPADQEYVFINCRINTKTGRELLWKINEASSFKPPISMFRKRTNYIYRTSSSRDKDFPLDRLAALIIPANIYNEYHSDLSAAGISIMATERMKVNLTYNTDRPEDSRLVFIERVIGIEGDTIEIKRKSVYLNGEELITELSNDHRYEYIKTKNGEIRKYPITLDIHHNNYWPYAEELWPLDHHCGINVGMRDKLHSVTVPAGHIFVLGDNRDNSLDSRFYGFVPVDRVVGYPAWRIMPWHRKTRLID